MKAFGGRTSLVQFLSVTQRPLRHLQAAVLSLVLIGFTISIASAQTSSPSQPGAHVYLLRGFANVFSLGLDELATKLRQHGVHTTVDNYLAWPTLAEQAAAEYKTGRVRAIVLVGHSSGAVAVTSMAARLSEVGVPVKLAIGLDPTSRMTTTGHIDRYINYYIANGFGDPVDRGQGFSGVLQNVDLEHMADVSHFNIDKDNRLQGMVIREILAAVEGGAALAPPITCDPYGSKSCGSAKRGALTEGTIGTAGR
jgi:pimeloyl-ACP methyl ester carboxylesterase